MITIWEFIKGKEKCPRCDGTGETDRGYGDIINHCDLCDSEKFVKIYRVSRVIQIIKGLF